MTRLIFLFLLIWPFTAFSQTIEVNWQPMRQKPVPTLKAELKQWEVYQVDATSLARVAGSLPEGVSFSWTLGNRKVEMNLFPDKIFSKDYRLTVATENGLQEYSPGTVRTYGGTTNSSGHVRMTLDADFIFGYWEEAGKVWFVQPLRHFDVDAPFDQFVVYEAGDVKPVKNARCGASHTAQIKQRQEVGEKTAKMVGQCYEVDIALASDFFMF